MDGTNAEAHDVAWSRAQPYYMKANMTLEEYKDLVMNSEKNKAALKKLVIYYLDYLEDVAKIGNLYEERILNDPMVLAGMKQPPEMNEERDIEEDKTGEGEWLNIGRCRDWIEKTERLMEGSITAENIHGAKLICTAVFNDALETIKMEELSIKESNEVDLNGDIFTPEEEESIIKTSKETIIREKDLLKTSLMADKFVSEMAMSVSM